MDSPNPDVSSRADTSSRFEIAMWVTFGLFVFFSLATVCIVLWAAPIQFFGAGLLAMLGSYVAAHHTREMHQDNKLGRNPSTEAAMFFDPRDVSN